MQAQPRILDLFCGCGGFSLGAENAGLVPKLAIDVDPILTSSFSTNHKNTKLYLSDISSIAASDIEREIGGNVDGIFGGPPCQGFSSIGLRKADDPRRLLLGHFFRLVSELKPAFFVMENVKGIGYADARHVLDEALELVRGKYELIEPVVLDASDFGAATKRPRLFVIGFDRDRVDPLTREDILAAKKPAVNVADAISDLIGSLSVGDEDGFDTWQYGASEPASEYAKKLRSSEGRFTGHKLTAHTDAVIERFRSVSQGGVDPIGRHHRLDWNRQCPTLRAGTGSDKGSFQSVRPIHPEEARVITVREAARLQGFPDWFRFHPTIWHSFRMIGNSVSPIISEAIFSLIAQRMDSGWSSRIAAE